MNFNSFNCPECLRGIRSGFGVFREDKERNIMIRICWNCHNFNQEQKEEGEQNEKEKNEKQD